MQCRIDALRIGQRVDLENDLYADPGGYESAQAGEESRSEHPEFEYAFEVVMEITIEPHDTDPVTVVAFESGFTCGFPPDHLIDVDGEQPTVTIKVWSSRLGWRWDVAEDHGGFDRISPSKGASTREEAEDAARDVFSGSIVTFEDGTPDHYGLDDGDAE
jgi:hypothetical protein